MSSFYTLNLKALVCTAIATVPTLLLATGIDAEAAQGAALAKAQQEQAAPVQYSRLAQLADVGAKAVLVD